MGTSKLNAGGNPAMDQHAIQGGVEILLVPSCYRTGIISRLMGHLARMQTLFPAKELSGLKQNESSCLFTERDFPKRFELSC